MIVLDAAAIVELLRATSAGGQVKDRLEDEDGDAHVPYLAATEAASALHSLVARRELAADRAELLIGVLADLPGKRYPAEPLLARMWELRQNLSMYDAHYVALAEALRAPLLTCDGRMARASGHRAVVEFIDVNT